ncbi:MULTISPECIES: DUF1878 family protein [Brevibacillus]|jgi:hypothetical protein|uniref:DUF1878 family protein n=1 Tax=Brevibacillus TaxID=55080 RepID=UPI001BA0EF2E|nr:MULTISPECIES: DUF1878 family protein [Brevibacillus]MBR8660730.1 DUF1878 family protein [Brevibacillus sp. NL20B1]MDT3414611.1 hypothetical protein [Brevibacillus aydinogluensis]
MKQESLEEKVERLEMYIDLLRQIAIDADEYCLWDWVISRGLSVDQFNNLKQILKHHVQVLMHAEKEENVKIPTFAELSAKLINILHTEDRPADTKTVMDVLKRAIKMPAYSRLQHYLSE